MSNTKKAVRFETGLPFIINGKCMPENDEINYLRNNELTFANLLRNFSTRPPIESTFF